MSLMSLDGTNRLIRYNRQAIDKYKNSMSSATMGEADSALRLRVLQQMEMSLSCLERHRDEIASRQPKDEAALQNGV